jgi:hypothetical protein
MIKRNELIWKTVCAFSGAAISIFLALAMTLGLFQFFSPSGIDNGPLLAAIIFSVVFIPLLSLCVASGLYVGTLIFKKSERNAAQQSAPADASHEQRGPRR